MLEVLNLTKVYKSKGGVEVRALDGVSLSFPERGMVFLLGKSGSGKSTLLNVCGGLDAPTSGEIIVKGRSSRDFTQSDFDSYRNTFIGFIFQEYNILNEFSVEDNIALALELQGKPKDKEAVAALLEQVDLTGYAKRKPNTLSGGQKQRIAIARALIKAPEIIMADEPTGALDSNTGKQVFDTLKKLSRDKLVIVVSHDRDFAEQYGDRVIELKDGKILSDVTKTVEEQKAVSANVTAIGETLCIKRGTQLTEGDFEKIKAFLSTAENDVVITGGEREVKAFREVTRITADGGQEVFRDTDESTVEKKAYTPEDSRFIRSKLPLRHAAKIGFSGLRTKPFRLFFTTLLCTIAFILFGLLSTLTFYDSEATFRETLVDSNQPLIKVSKYFNTKVKTYEYGEFVHEYEYSNTAKFSKAELDAFAARIGTRAVPVFAADINISAQQQAMYWQNAITYYAVLGEDNGIIGATLHGEYPAADNEIMISDYLADSLINTKAFLSNGDALSITERGDLIGKKFTLDLTYGGNSDNTYTIVGIFKGPDVPEKYEPLKESGDNVLRSELAEWLADGTAQLVIVTQNKMDAIVDRFSYSYSYYGDAFSDHDMSVLLRNRNPGDGGMPSETWEDNGYYASAEYLPKTGVYYFDDAATTIGAKQAVVNSQYFYERLREITWAKSEALNAEGDKSGYNREDYRLDYDTNYGVSSPIDIMMWWADGLRSDPDYAPQAGLEAVFADFKEAYYDADNAIFNNAKYDTGAWAEFTQKLVALGIEENAASMMVDEWERYIRWNESGLTMPQDGDAEYPVYQEYVAFYETFSAYNGDYWGLSTEKFAFVQAIDTAVGEKFVSFDTLLENWENTYADENSAHKPASLTALYDEWRAAYAPSYEYRKACEFYNSIAVKVDMLLGYGMMYDEETGEYRDPTDEELEDFREELFAFHEELPAEEKLTFKVKLLNRENMSSFGETIEYTPIGVYKSEDWGLRLYIPKAEADSYWQLQRVLLSWSNETTTRYVEEDDAVYESAFIVYDSNNAALTEALTKLYMDREVFDENDVNYTLSSALASTFGMVDSMVSEFSKIFLYVGLVLAVFAALLLSNFISVSISHKRREIGILRAVGARSLDVFKIFFSESFFITALCVFLSLVGSLVICSVINGILVEMLGASLFVFGILSVAVLIGVALVTAVLATFLPVYNAAKKKPVEAIRSL